MEDERSVPEHRKYEFKAFLRLLSPPPLVLRQISGWTPMSVSSQGLPLLFREPVSRRNTS